MASFVRNVLPGILEDMQTAHGWANVPRTVVHDKASYMVTAAHERLHVSFADALSKAGFSSWIGGVHDTTRWLAPKWGDVYPYETVIAHIRRLLDNEYTCPQPYETVQRFKARMQKVEDHMNSPAFSAAGGRGLAGLARDLLPRCAEVVLRRGERIPK